MSINVTVHGNPISIRRGKVALSDLENIKKSEKEHRKRLRLEQVHEQSKALSKRLLERSKQKLQEQLKCLEKDDNTEIKRAHDRRLMELHRRYQDIENIGYAHELAAKQPDVENIKQVEEEKNKAVAKARGADAAQRLQEMNKIISPPSKHQERLRKVRDLENERSCMVAQLPKKSHVNDPSEHDNIVRVTPATISRKKIKCVVSKKTPVKKTKQSKISKTPSQTFVSESNDDTNITPMTTISSTNKSKHKSPDRVSNIPKTVSDSIEKAKGVNVCESDDNEPRKTVPVTSSTISDKPEQFIRYTSDKYKESSSSDLSSTSTTSSSTISDDSSYFSGDTSKNTVFKKTPKQSTNPSKINLYDHKTRHRNTYDAPCGLVERINIKNKANANDLAQEIIQLENKETEALANKKAASKQRSRDAVLREQIRNDYQALLKKLDQFSKEERKLKAHHILSSAANEQVLPPSKKKEDLAKKQKKMERAFQNILRSSRDPVNSDSHIERPITITPRDYVNSKSTPITAWKEAPYVGEQETEESDSEDECNLIRKRKISELLIKIEKLKRRLLHEYGADLPDEIFNASVKSLFNQTSTSSSEQKIECNTRKPATPEIQVINMSGCEDSSKLTNKVNNNKNKKIINKTPRKGLSKLSKDNIVTTRDQEIQVEIEKEKETKEIVSNHIPLEPIVKIRTPENVDSSSSICSNSSVVTDVMIGVSKKEIKIIPKESTAKSSKSTSVISSTKLQSSSSKVPVKICFEQKDGSASFEVAGLLIDPTNKEITVIPKKRKSPEIKSKEIIPAGSEKSHSLPGSRACSPIKNLPKSAPSSRHSSPKKMRSRSRQNKFENRETKYKEQRYRTQYTQVSIDSSTESSQFNSTSENEKSKFYTSLQTLLSKRMFTLQDTSDASTTYASPPAVAVGAFLNSIHNSTAILELLDPCINEALREMAHEVSPVSSPETPSPRTMMLPSNRLKPGQVTRKLKLIHPIDYQKKSDQTNVSKNTQTSYTESKDQSNIAKQKSQTQTQSHTQTHAQSQSQPQASFQPQIKRKSQPQSKTKCQFLIQTKKIQSQTKTQMQTPVNKQLKTRAQMLTPTKTQVQTKIRIGTPTKTKTKSQTQSQTKVQAQTQTLTPPEIKTQNLPDIQFETQISPEIKNKIETEAQTPLQTQTKVCTCNDPGCRLFHEKLAGTQSYALKHCPEILKKYEDLQNVCTERIASLTDLIQKVRNEKKGLELSVVTNADSTSVNQIFSNLQSSANGNVSQLVKNIEAIHAEIKKTLTESRKIISGEKIKVERTIVPCSQIEKSPSVSLEFSKDSTSSEGFEEQKEKNSPIPESTTISKPRILSNEPINIKLDRFHNRENSKAATTQCSKTSTAMAEPKITETPQSALDQNEDMVEMLSKEILEQSKSINKSVPLDSLKDSDDSFLKSSQAPVKESGEVKISPQTSKNILSNDENQSSNLELNDSNFIPLLADIPKMLRAKNSTNSRGRPPVTLISGPYRTEIDSPAHELSTIVEFDTPDTVNKSQVSTKSTTNKCRKKLTTSEVAQSTTSPSPSKKDTKSTKSKPSVQVAPLPAHRSPQLSQNLSGKSTKSIEKSPRKSLKKSSDSLNKKQTSENKSQSSESSDSLHTLPDVHIEHLQQSQENTDANNDFRNSQISDLHSLPDENIDQLLISEICEESKSKSVTPVQKQSEEQVQKEDFMRSTSSTSFSGLSGVSEITSTPSSDLNVFKCPSSPEGMELALKKWGLGWAIPTLKKTREASALGSSSSSDVTPVNTAARLVSPVKKHHDGTGHDLPEISDISSISIKHANKSTERSVLAKGRTSTPNRLSNSNSDGTISTLGSLSDFNIVVQNNSADITIPNISFSNNKLG